ncbi:hypothetical protein Ait01nite_079000 [Actinoplanes italicus]|nr:hypothetical protein Ait01nite_079000 [Actinoplanes italicus]
MTRLPDRAKAGHLATVRVNDRVTVEPTAIRHLQTIALRHTDRRGPSGIAVDADTLRPIAAAAESQQTLLHLLRPRQIFDLASATDDARRIESGNQAWQAELRDWGGTGSPRTGTPDTAVLPEASTATVPGRNSGRCGDMAVADTQDRTAAFAILYGPGDSDLDWLRAGEALSAVCLKATESGLSVQPLSSTIEVGATREIVKHLLPGPGHPYLVLRFGVLDATASDPSRTPRLPAEQIAVQP